ncbi:MAG: twin-arginine translocation signal domain-containing protein [Rhodanobacteraceae bacterium]|nr:MAG: twin-arginine translocation signal domain-containing protein [Rhodanobacteraceae bacterium]
MKEETVSPRRRFLKLAGGVAAAAVLVGSLPRRAWAALPHLTQANNATAKALHYVEDNTKAPAPHKPGQDCTACVHYQGKPGQAYGGCAIFPGFDVNAKGWCAGFQAKS